ncbi:MAG: hypothetical protein LBT14_02875 [Treponema sp.]|nr:hypothetical protein [Treponema sp.]
MKLKFRLAIPVIAIVAAVTVAISVFFLKKARNIETEADRGGLLGFEMKNHALPGVKIIEEIAGNTPESSFLTDAKIISGTNHEKWNSTGYPGDIKKGGY